MKAILIDLNRIERANDPVPRHWADPIDIPAANPDGLYRWLSENHYEIVDDPRSSFDYGIAVYTGEMTVALEKERFIYIPDKRIACFGSVLVWSPREELSQQQLMSLVMPAELPDNGVTVRDMVQPIRQLKCFRCGNPVSTYDENMQPYCLECRMVALPPGVSLEKHLERCFWNQPRFDCDVYPVAARKILQEKFKNHMGDHTEKGESDD